MAARCSSSNTAAVQVQVVVVAVAVAAMMMMTMSPGGAAYSAHIECPSGLVYPYWSTCWRPAKYGYAGGVYELAAAAGDVQGSLAPEWDETNSTYYVRLAEDGAKYSFAHLTREWRPAVAQSDDVMIQNVETGRRLGWRQEGDEYFLVELEDGFTRFQFSKAEEVSLPCPRIANARCEAYYILNFNTSLGLTPYVEDGATYFTLSDSSSALAFALIDSSTNITTSRSSVQHIKMPTAAAN